MNLPRFRFTLRWMMVAVAILAVALAVIQKTKVIPRWAFCRREAANYAFDAQMTRQELARAEARSEKASTVVDKFLTRQECEYNRRWVEYYSAQSRRFAHAAVRPWLSTEYAPPPPPE